MQINIKKYDITDNDKMLDVLTEATENRRAIRGPN